MAIEVIVVGMGSRGRDWVREVRKAPAFRLAGCVDVERSVLEAAVTGLGISPQQCFLDLPRAIEETGAGAVLVATSPDSHVEPCETALSRGLAVMVEKPFALSLSEAVHLVSLAEQQGVPLLVAQNYRYMRSFRAIRRLIGEGALGHVNMVTCQYYRPVHEMAPSLARLPHNVLWGMGVHHLDALRYTLGSEVTNVSAESFSRHGASVPAGASLQAMLSFAGDARAVYSASYESSGHEYFEKGQEFYARFVGDRATLHVFHRWLILCEKNKLPRLVRRGPRKMTEEQILLREFERALLTGEPVAVSGRDNLKTMAVLEACVRSAAEHKWINPQDLLDDSK